MTDSYTIDLSQLASSTPMMLFLAFLVYEVRQWRTSVVPQVAMALFTLADAIDPDAAARALERARGRRTPPMGVVVVRPPTAPPVGNGG